MSKVAYDNDNENDGHAVGKLDKDVLKYKNEISEHDNDTEKNQEGHFCKLEHLVKKT